MTSLDVGCGNSPRGDVNVDVFRGGLNPQLGDQIEGEFMFLSKIKNFIVADATHLPFRDGSFATVFSSHTIEHVQNPLLMLREMCRVANEKTVVRCPHRKGSGAIRTYHVNYLDEDWFKKACRGLDVKCKSSVISYDLPFTLGFKKLFGKLFLTFEKSLFLRGWKFFERRTLMKVFSIPYELEVYITR